MPNIVDKNIGEVDIYAEALESAYDYIKKLIVGVEKYLENMNDNKISESVDLLISIIEGLEWEVNALSLIKEKVNIKLDIEESNLIFINLSNALENKDYVLITDLFEYEILPMLKKWKGYLDNN